MLFSDNKKSHRKEGQNGDGTDGHCIKDVTTIDGICSTGNSLTNTNDGRVVKVECGNAKYMGVNA